MSILGIQSDLESHANLDIINPDSLGELAPSFEPRLNQPGFSIRFV